MTTPTTLTAVTRRLLIAVLSLVLAGSACGGGGGDTFTSDFRNQLVGSCGDSGQPEAYCVCWVDELDARYSQDELLRLLQDESNEMPEGFFEAGFACAALLDG